MDTLNPRTVHRKLISRIGLTGIILAILIGSGVWQYERKNIGQNILSRAEFGFRFLNNQLRDDLDDTDRLDASAIHRRLVKLLEVRHPTDLGQFVWICIYDLNGQRIAKIKDAAYENITQIETSAGRVPDTIIRYNHLIFEVIEQHDVPHIQIIAPLKNNRNELSAYGETFFAISPDVVRNIRQRAVKLAFSAISIVLVTTILIYPVVVRLLSRVSSLSSRLLEANLEILKVLGSAIAQRDSDTDAHNYRVTIISVKIGEICQLPPKEIRRLIKGAFLHDVGKIGIEDRILHKPGRLAEEEFEIMKKHVDYGIDIVQNAEWLKETVAVVGYHHEKFDGSGYTRGIKKESIPVIARIFAIADVFDALTARRPYKEPYSYDQTMDILRAGRGTHFDPELLDRFETLSESIYQNYAEREDPQLKEEMNRIIKQYFYT